MPAAESPLPERLTALHGRLDAAVAGQLTAAETAGCLEFGRQALGAGRADLAVDLLREFTRLAPDEAEGWRLLGFAHREEQQMDLAIPAFARAAALAPGDALSALAHAEAAFACGLPAAALFGIPLALAPGDLGVIRGRALALAAEGGIAAAEDLLEHTLARYPDWLEGHRSLATLRHTWGDTQGYARSYAQACAARPHNCALRLAWFGAVAQARDWTGALGIVEAGERLLGASTAWTLARLFVAAESGEQMLAEHLFAQTADLRDTTRDLAFIRHCLRSGQPGRAEPVALRALETPAAAAVWPYLSLIWRLLDDERARWLEAPPRIESIDLDLTLEQREELAALLRRLHVARAPHLEQSVRGGTQTDGQILFRTEPVMQLVRARIESAVRGYVERLPAPVPGHPLLGVPRTGRPLFAGSWSVRLQGGGHHVSHTHPMGWISSALYISLPPGGQAGSPPAGWIRFGSPPPELGLKLAPYCDIEPQPGRLVLFPSTLWHSTLPFAAGERLVIAFDVRAPRQ